MRVAEAMNRVGMYYGPGEVRVVDLPMPEVRPNDILVKVAACGICGSDLRAYHSPHSLPFNTVLGHEFCGTVAACGSSITDISPGERVTVNPMRDLMGVGGEPGAFAVYVLVKRPL